MLNVLIPEETQEAQFRDVALRPMDVSSIPWSVKEMHHGHVVISRKSMMRIMSMERWLNDEVVTAYMWLLNMHNAPLGQLQRCVCVSSFLLIPAAFGESDHDLCQRLAKFFRKLHAQGIDARRCNRLFIPVNRNRKHWVGVVFCMDRADDHVVHVYDSMPTMASVFTPLEVTTIKVAYAWLRSQNGVSIGAHDVRLQFIGGIRQTDSTSCGVIVCMVALCHRMGWDAKTTIRTDPSHIMTYRRLIYNSILDGIAYSSRMSIL